MGTAALLIHGCAPVAPQADAGSLGGSAWRLVRFQGGDGTTLVPDDKPKYTIAFAPDGALSVRFDCNRGRGTWKSRGSNHVEFGPLFLSLMADGGIYEFEPAQEAK